MVSGVAVIALGIAGGRMAWISVRSPLVGDRSHDWGVVAVPDDGVILEYTFSLRNRTSHTLVVRGIAATCNCAHPRVPRKQVEPGQWLEIPTTFSLKTRTQRHAEMLVDLGDDGVVKLSLSVEGREPDGGQATGGAKPVSSPSAW